MKKTKNSFWNWNQKIGLFLILVAICAVVISLIILATVSFNDGLSNYLGNGFWSLKKFGLINIFNNWSNLHDTWAAKGYIMAFYQVYIAIVLLIIFSPLISLAGCMFWIRGWWKNKI